MTVFTCDGTNLWDPSVPETYITLHLKGNILHSDIYTVRNAHELGQKPSDYGRSPRRRQQMILLIENPTNVGMLLYDKEDH